MTFIVLAATLVTATFLFSPTIEKIFGEESLESLTFSRSGRVREV